MFYVTKSIDAVPDAQELYLTIKGQYTPVGQHTFDVLLSEFLDTRRRMTLNSVTAISTSTASRFMQQSTDYLAQWEKLRAWQSKILKKYRKRMKHRRPKMLIRIDLTSIEKTGKKLPFNRVYNGTNGLHLVVAHVGIGKLSFPMGALIYDPAQPEKSHYDLALELLKLFAGPEWSEVEKLVLLDSGFYSGEMLKEIRTLGFPNISIGGRKNLLLTDGRRLEEAKRGEAVELRTAPGETLWVAWVDLPRAKGMKRFFVLDTVQGVTRTLLGRHAKRWLIESFFKSAKYEFGLNETRLRSEAGTKNWLFMVFLAVSMAIWVQVSQEMTTWKRPSWMVTLREAAEQLRNVLLSRIVAINCLATLAAIGYYPPTAFSFTQTHKNLVIV